MRTFSTLAEAVSFLADALENRDDDALAGACHEPLPAEWIMDRLREQAAETPLVRLYAGRDFPSFGQTFKLGGHAKELGHIHIDFVRRDRGWEIQKIWMCR
jgi:hypothetical protein